MQQIEPEQGELCEDAALVRDGCGHDHIESRQAIGGHDQQAIFEIVDIADFSASRQAKSRRNLFLELFLLPELQPLDQSPGKATVILTQRTVKSMWGITFARDR